MSSKKKITLKSSDGKTFKVEETVALESQTIKHMVEDDCADTVIPVPNVTSTILSKVIEYCKKHVEARSGDKKDDKSTILRILSKVIGCCKKHVEDDLKTWDADFVKVDNNTLFDLILAANYLNIKSLLDLISQTAADMTRRRRGASEREPMGIRVKD